MQLSLLTRNISVINKSLFVIICDEAVTTKLFIKHNAYEASHIIECLEGGWGGWGLLH
jgi:hypothetical protein